MRAKLLSAAAAVSALFAAAPASAVTFSGTTAGCFGVACAPAGAANINGAGGLSFLAGAFTQNDSNGFFSIGSLLENLGTFTLGGTGATYNNNPFTLQIDWTSPSGASPDPVSYSATVFGSVSSTTNGGVNVNFDNNPLNFTYNGGSFTFAVNDVAVNSGGMLTQITGYGTVAAVPEPSTWAMMLFGFGAVGFGMRRRNARTGALRMQAA